jgi:predicted Zn-dependent peptidase
MISINRHILSNGLRIVHHEDRNTSMVAVNVLYNVGARDENPERTGFAHLFEHLMFGGSVNIPDYDSPLQQAGADNNAWTNNDITNYYISIPAENLETAFWLESDRMLELAFSQDSLDIQKNVVIEEFKQRNLNQPYGDVHHLLRALAYKVHPYQWSTIGKDISHIANATLEEVKDFYYRFYAPNNAVLSVVGNVTFGEVVRLAEKWFAPIEKLKIAPKNIQQEPPQTGARKLEVYRKVPADGIYKAYHMVSRLHPDYPAYDMLSDLLANGRSARLPQRLIQQQQLFSEINAYVSGDIDPGLFHITGKLNEGVSMSAAESAIDKVLNEFVTEELSDYELEKVKNKFESNHIFSQINYLNKATNLAYYELISKAENINCEVGKYRAITAEKLQTVAIQLFSESNSSTLYYFKES